MPATLIKIGVFDLQVCVPTDWTDDQVVEFTKQRNPSGTDDGWSIRRQGCKRLGGCDERVPCKDLDGHVHLALEC